MISCSICGANEKDGYYPIPIQTEEGKWEHESCTEEKKEYLLKKT